ncbi:hypothetical protein [Alteromonas facilis]|uniref:hypothetical protein n=1 Tax=Alteromonas facilis TaxID=2048004 RepID=UPI000C28C9A7|nr:hypothetical protein [Alteromonas facilis]
MIFARQTIDGHLQQVNGTFYVDSRINAEIKPIVEVFDILFSGLRLSYLIGISFNEKKEPLIELLITAETADGNFPIESEMEAIEERCASIIKKCEQLQEIKNNGDLNALEKFKGAIGNIQQFEQIEKLRQKRSKPGFLGAVLQRFNLNISALNRAANEINVSTEVIIETQVHIINLKGLRLEFKQEKKRYLISFDRDAHENIMSCLTKSPSVIIQFIATQITDSLIRGEIVDIYCPEGTHSQQTEIVYED